MCIRDRHGTDDDRRRVHVQTDARNHDGEHQNPEVESAEFNVLFDALYSGLGVGQVADLKTLDELWPQNLDDA